MDGIWRKNASGYLRDVPRTRRRIIPPVTRSSGCISCHSPVWISSIVAREEPLHGGNYCVAGSRRCEWLLSRLCPAVKTRGFRGSQAPPRQNLQLLHTLTAGAGTRRHDGEPCRWWVERLERLMQECRDMDAEQWGVGGMRLHAGLSQARWSPAMHWPRDTIVETPTARIGVKNFLPFRQEQQASSATPIKSSEDGLFQSGRGGCPVLSALSVQVEYERYRAISSMVGLSAATTPANYYFDGRSRGQVVS